MTPDKFTTVRQDLAAGLNVRKDAAYKNFKTSQKKRLIESK